MNTAPTDTTTTSNTVSRRQVLRAIAGGAALAAAGPTVLAACGSSSKTSTATTLAPAAGTSTGGATSATAATGNISIGSNHSNGLPAKAFATTLAAFEAANPQAKVSVNTVSHTAFQNNIENYLQGTPQDIFTWFAGYRMRFFAAQNLLHPIDNVWDVIAPNFAPGFQAASKGNDGHYYFVPLYNYPWAVFYRKSVFASKGYTIPRTWDQFVALQKQMKSDGLIPMAMGDKEGWPALGTFDILNMRINGYDFHMQLMNFKVPWDDPKVLAVFDQWKEILPYQQTGAAGIRWEDAAATLQKKQAGMYLLGTFVTEEFQNPSDLADLDFFPYPEINPTYGQDAIDAPIDGFCMSKHPGNIPGDDALLEFLGSPKAEEIYVKIQNGYVAASKNADTSFYNPIQTRSAEIIKSTANIAQFLDRDTNPGFADDTVAAMIQHFFNDPGNVKSQLSALQGQAKLIANS